MSTVQRFVSQSKLSKKLLEPKDRRAFEMEYPNDCWQSDISTGPYLYLDNRKVKTYIVAFLDDASRLITHIECFTQDNLLSVLSAFKKAVGKRGIPKKLDETKAYIEYMLKAAGVAVPIFDDSAIELLFTTTNGYIRKINNLVTMSLVAGSQAQRRTIDGELVYQSQNELSIKS